MTPQISPFWRAAPLLLLAHALQTTWFSTPLFGLARPDLPFLVALSLALLGGVEVGAVAGIAAGVLSGLGAAWHGGSFLVSRALPPALFGALARRFAVFHPFAPPLCAFVATGLVDALFLLMSPTDFSLFWMVRHAGLTGLLHAGLIWPIFWLVARVVKPPQRPLFV
ncbi:MAG TPA: hypothetical protein VF627_13240 [Abditibacterium sp.]|jgi:hypothetical protein